MSQNQSSELETTTHFDHMGGCDKQDQHLARQVKDISTQVMETGFSFRIGVIAIST